MNKEDAQTAKGLLSDLLKELQRIQTDRTDGTFEGRLKRLRRWHDHARDRLAPYLTQVELSRFEDCRGSLNATTPEDVLIAASDFLTALHNDAQRQASKAIPFFPPAASERAFPATRRSRTVEDREKAAVFLVHGHDMTNTLLLEKLLRDRQGITAIILRFQPGKGRTLIEKFEEEAPAAGYAFALFTADDVVAGDAKGYAQARPNVVFELGWFCGRLGRDKTCILFKRGTKIPSDLDGLERHEFDSSVEEVYGKIVEELKAAKVLR